MFDPFAGAGTTLSATIECGENRKCITSDISNKSIKMILDKYQLFNLNTNGHDLWSIGHADHLDEHLKNR